MTTVAEILKNHRGRRRYLTEPDLIGIAGPDAGDLVRFVFKTKSTITVVTIEFTRLGDLIEGIETAITRQQSDINRLKRMLRDAGGSS